VKIEDIRALDMAVLRDKEREAKEELQRLRFQAGFGQLKENDVIRKKRKLIARIKTIIKEKLNPTPKAKTPVSER
jgi:ribosomal protein L29